MGKSSTSSKKKTKTDAARTSESTDSSADSGASVLRRIGHNMSLIAVMAFSVVVILGIAILPLRTWLQQRELTAATKADLTELQSEVDELRANYLRLQTDDEIERLGRDNFDLVYPGEESYRILPPPEG